MASTDAARVIDAEIRRFVDDAHDRALVILRTWRGALDRVAETLLVRETLTAEELASLSGTPPSVQFTPRDGGGPVPRAAGR